MSTNKILGVSTLVIILGTSMLLFQQNTTYSQTKEGWEPFVFLVKITGGDIPIGETIVYDSLSNQYVDVLGNDTTKNAPDPEEIKKIASALELSDIQTIESDSGSCDFESICYLLQVTKPFGMGSPEESYMVFWNSNSGEQYDTLTDIVSNITSLRN